MHFLSIPAGVLMTSLIGAILLPSHAIAASGSNYNNTSNTTPYLPVDPCAIYPYSNCASFYGVGASSSSYQLECDEPEDKEVHHGDIVISEIKELDAYRCYRVVTGDLVFDGDEDEDFYAAKYLVLPYLEKVVGDLIVDGNEFNQIWLPRLASLDGNINFDLRIMFEQLRLPLMTSFHEVDIKTRDMSNNFTGFDNISFIDTLKFNDTSTDDAATFGLLGLQSVNYLVVKGSDIDEGGSGFLDNFTTVNHDVTINGSMTSLWMLEHLNHIGGNLTINATNLDDFF